MAVEEPAKPRRPLWDEILGVHEGQIPPPQADLVWFDDLNAAVEVAQAGKRPILVVAQCPEASQSGDLAKSLSSASGPLESLLRQFVTVRLENGWMFDYRLLESQNLQDPDCTEWIWFLTESGAALSCFGGRVSEEDSNPAARIEGFERIARRVLEHYSDPRRDGWKIDRSPPDAGPLVTAREQFQSGYTLWKTRFRRNLADPTCLRCHQAQEMLFLHRTANVMNDRRTEMLLWPEVEQAGLVLKNDGGLQVVEVRAGSPAAATGFQPGDELGSSFDRRIFSRADLRAALNATPDSGGAHSLRWLRNGEVMEGKLVLPSRWKERPPEELGWRASLLYGPLGPIPGFVAKPLADEVRKRVRLPPGASAYEAVLSRDSPALSRGIQPGDIVIGVNGQRPMLDARSWMVWFRRTFEGSQVVQFDLISPKTGVKRTVSYIPFGFEPKE